MPLEEEVPKTTIPHQPQVTMQGVTQQFVPTIMRCNMGGFIVVMQGKGISAHSQLSGALAFVAAEAYAAMGDEGPNEEMPGILHKTFEERMTAGRILKSRGQAAFAMCLALASFFAVKLA